MSTIFYLIGLYLITRTISVDRTGCLPANTCFTILGGSSDSAADSSYKITCDSAGSITKTKYLGNTDCSADGDATTLASGGTISAGDTVVGSASGAITTAYLQGTNCPINEASEHCTKYMVLKHRGDDGYTSSEGDAPYLDVGNNCTNYIGKESTFTHYTSVQIPLGCVNVYVGSNLFSCNADGWGYVHYDGKDCTGNTESAQTDNFDVDKCGYFSEWTHCGGSQGCTVHDYWWYWYDLDCCPVTGKTCTGTAAGGSSGGTTTTSAATTTSAPTTPSPTGPGMKGTASPTAKPTTSAPTAKPTTSAPTAKPTTSAPTAPTMASRSDMKCAIFGLLMMIAILVNM